MSMLIVLICVAVVAGLWFRILNRTNNGCTGSCEQGRKPCDCPLKRDAK